MRKDVKKYIDTADPKVLKMMHAMLEVDADAGWWDEMTDEAKADVEEAIRQADNGETMTHADVKKNRRNGLQSKLDSQSHGTNQ